MKSSFGRSFSVFAGILLVALTVLGGSFQMMVQDYLTETSFTRLEQDAAIIQNLAACLDENSMSSREFLMNLDVAAKVSGSDAVICNTKGKVVICSDGTADCGHKGLYVNRDYLNKVIEQGGDRATGIIKGLYEDERFLVSSPITNEDGQNLGILIVSSPLAGVNAVLTKISNIFLTIAAFVVLASVAAVSVFARRESKPLQEMAKVANAFGHGNLEARVKIEESYSEEVEELALAFNNMASSLQKSEYRRQEFVANVSHELKTPMTTISGYVDGMLDKTIPAEKWPHYLQIVSDETKRLSRLVRSMLDISQLQTQEGIPEEKKVQFDLEDASSQVLLTFEKKIDDKHINVEVDMPDHPVFTFANEDYITQVIYNLIDNAVKFSPQNGQIRIRLKQLDGSVTFSIWDNGLPIPKADIDRIFNKFYQGDNSHASEGNGLGLALVRKIVAAAHGTINVTSSEDAGTEFVVALPNSSSDS